MPTETNAINAATTGIVGNTGTAFTGTAVTQYNVITGASTSSTLNNVAPSSTSGVPLISQGSSSQPLFGTAVVAGGGTGQVTLTNHGVLVGAGTSAITQLAVGSTGQVLTGSTGADPVFAGTPLTINTDSGSAAASSSAVTFNAVSQAGSSVTFSGSSATVSLNVTDANNNTIIGQLAGNGSLTASKLTAVGYNALHASSSGNANTAIGYHALQAISSNIQCTAVGSQALEACTGSFNTGIGQFSLNALTSGTSNVALGQNSAYQVQTGSNNTCLGEASGSNYTSSESSNIQIGMNTVGTAAESNVLRIGNGTGTGTGQINVCQIAGITGKTSTSGIAVLVNSSNVLGTTTSSIRFKQNVQDIGESSERILKLRPVSFNYKVSLPHVNEEDSHLLQYGLIAEEVLPTMPEMVAYGQDGQIDTLRYHFFIPMLLNELQKAVKRIEELENKVSLLEGQNGHK